MKTWRVVIAIEAPDDWQAQDFINIIEPSFNGVGIDRLEPVEGMKATVEEMEEIEQTGGEMERQRKQTAKQIAARWMAEEIRFAQRVGTLSATIWEKCSIPPGMTAEEIDKEINAFQDAWITYLESQAEVEEEEEKDRDRERHVAGCVCADCSGADLTARND